MGRALPEFSLKEKVLLWIRHVAEAGDDEAVLASTQVGIAEATGLSRGHVSRTVAPLLQADLLVEEPRRVSGFSRVLKGYALTPAGRRESERLAEVLLACQVDVRRAGSPAGRLRLVDVVERRLAGRGLWPALQQVWHQGFVDLEAGRTEPVPFRFLREMADAPGAAEFVGRGREVVYVERWLRGNGRILSLEGPGGVGKTTLAGHVLRQADPRRHVVWVRVTDWLTGRDLIARLDAALERLGQRPGPMPSEEAGPVAEHLAPRMRHLPLIVVLDDVQKASGVLRRVVEGVLRAARGSPSCKVILIGRRVSLPADLARESEPLALGPLPAEDADRLLAGRGLSPLRRRDVAAAAQGNPLFLELLSRSSEDGGTRAASVADYLARDLAADLPAPHRELLDWCSAVRTPMPMAFWERLDVGSEAAVEELADASLLKRRDDGRIDMHDVVREAFYGQMAFARRRTIHARLAKAYAPRGADGDVAEFLHHLVRAGQREEAVRWVLRNRTRLMERAHEMFRPRFGTA